MPLSEFSNQKVTHLIICTVNNYKKQDLSVPEDKFDLYKIYRYEYNRGEGAFPAQSKFLTQEIKDPEYRCNLPAFQPNHCISASFIFFYQDPDTKDYDWTQYYYISTQTRTDRPSSKTKNCGKTCLLCFEYVPNCQIPVAGYNRRVFTEQLLKTPKLLQPLEDLRNNPPKNYHQMKFSNPDREIWVFIG